MALSCDVVYKKLRNSSLGNEAGAGGDDDGDDDDDDDDDDDNDDDDDVNGWDTNPKMCRCWKRGHTVFKIL